jgi:hypothetical protein
MLENEFEKQVRQKMNRLHLQPGTEVWENNYFLVSSCRIISWRWLVAIRSVSREKIFNEKRATGNN